MKFAGWFHTEKKQSNNSLLLLFHYQIARSELVSQMSFFL